MFDGGLSGSMQVGRAKDIPLMEKKRKHTLAHTRSGVLVCVCVALARKQKTRRVWFCSQERDE